MRGQAPFRRRRAGRPMLPSTRRAGFTACGEFDTTGRPAPMHVDAARCPGSNNVESPSECAVTDAPYGTESAGPEQVVLVTDLVPGMPYVVHRAARPTTCCSTSRPVARPRPVRRASSACCSRTRRRRATRSASFVAPSPSVYVVVDYYASHAPPEAATSRSTCTRRRCMSNGDCAGADPVCSNGACVQCATSFDCVDPTASLCDTTHQHVRRRPRSNARATIRASPTTTARPARRCSHRARR